MKRCSVPRLLLGSLVVAAFVQVLFRLWRRSITVAGSMFQFSVAFSPVTYLQSCPVGTVLETALASLWLLPKFLFVFLVMDAAVDPWCRRAKV